MEDPCFGRYAVAAKDLPAGTLVFSEEPFVQTVHDRFDTRLCHVCYCELAPAATNKHVCRDCGTVRYCSLACMRRGLAAHEAECGVLSMIAASGNTAMQRGVRGLRLFIRLLHRAAADPAAFKEVEQMQDHYDEEQEEVLSPWSSLIHLGCLRRTSVRVPYDTQRRAFWDQMAVNINRFVPPEVRMEPSRLARLANAVHTNLYGVCDMGGVQFGSGLYAFAGAHFNHCCAPTAVVSFLGRTWRLHTLKAVSKGEEIAVSYTDIFEARDTRRTALQEKKGFVCRCHRCVTPPIEDFELDGWICVACAAADARAGRAAATPLDGAVPAGEAVCSVCGAAHALTAAARTAIQARWREEVDKAHANLMGSSNSDTGASAATAACAPSVMAVARSVLPAMEKVLSASDGKLCESHALRHHAKVLRCYAQSALEGQVPTLEVVDALRQCLAGMLWHLPTYHPERSLFRQRLGAALIKLAQQQQKHGTESPAAGPVAELWREARDELLAAANGLGVAYGNDHPTVKQWRKEALAAAMSAAG